MDRQTENGLTIAEALGVPVDKALELLHKSVEVLSVDAGRNNQIPTRTVELLSRTFDSVKIVDSPSTSADLVICWGQPCDADRSLTVTCERKLLSISPEVVGTFDPTGLGIGQQTVAACYVASAASRILVPGISNNNVWPLKLDLGHFTVSNDGRGYIDIGNAYLVGAGAIGNGFIWALENNTLLGNLTLIDDDHVSDGNLQRNVLNHEADVKATRTKVDVLAEYLHKSQPHLNVTSQAQRAEKYFGALGAELRISRLISAVDSPRARRALQKWLPREIFDASTSGIQEVVFHHNVHPLRHACLECIYPFTPEEQAHELHVADTLGVSLEALSEGIISEARAKQIIKKYPQQKSEEIIGEAYDSLFKRLCGAGLLNAGEGKRVLAPLAFVSVLAGAVLAVEFQKRVSEQETSKFNYWRLSPWAAPRLSLQRLIPKQSVCRFCSDEINMKTMNGIWKST